MEVEYFPFARKLLGFQNGAGHYAQRAGFLFRSRETTASAWVYSEASPLPGFSSETFSDIEQFLLNSSNKMTLLHAFAGESAALPPSLRFAAESIQLGEVPDLCEPLQCSGLVGISNSSQMLKELAALFANDFRTFKIKLSLETLLRTISLLEDIAIKFPTAKIRLDANSTLSKTAFSSFCESIPETVRPLIEYIEDPYGGFENDSPGDWGIPIAIDGPFSKFAQHRLFELPSDFIFIIKPNVHLGPQRIASEALRAASAGKKIVFSSSFESEVGLIALQNLCIRYADRDRAHGIATASIFTDPLMSDLSTLRSAQKISDPLSLWLTTLSWRPL